MKSTHYHHGNLGHDAVITAIALIERSGIENLSLRTVATTCGVSATAIYRHFADKHCLLLACATEGYRRLAVAMKEASKPFGHDVQQELNHLGMGYLTFAYQHPKLFTFMFSADLSAASPEQMMVFLESYQNLRRVAEKGVVAGVFIGDVDTVTCRAWSLVHGFATLVITNRIPISSVEEFAKLARDIFVWPAA